MKFRHTITAVLMLLSCTVAQRAVGAHHTDANGFLVQPTKKYISGVAIDSSDRRPVPGARVMVVVGSDTLRKATDMGGMFRIGPINGTEAQLRINSRGYRDTTRTLHLTHNLSLDTLALRPARAIELDSVTVTGERALTRWRGDTVVYNASAIKVLPGDDVSEVVKRLPGITYEEGKITFQGKTISRTYVDGKPLFGQNAQTALDYLEAHEIVDIQVYDELTEEEKMMKNPNGEKRTVMNLITRSKPKSSVNMRVRAGIGSDIDADAKGKHDTRYTTRINTGRFSEHTSANITFSSGNNNQGTGTRRNTSTGFNLGYRNGDKLHINGNYRFSDTRTTSSAISRNVYFPTEKYTSRTYDDTSRVANHDQGHSFDFNMQSFGKQNTVFINSSGSLDRSDDNSYRGSLNTMNDKPLNSASTGKRNWGNSYNVSESVDWSHTTANRHHVFRLNEHANLSNRDNSGWQSDSLMSDSARTYLDNRNTGFNRSIGATLGYKYVMGDNSLGVSYNISYNHGTSRRIAVDRATGMIDTTLSSDYTRNYTAQTYTASFERRTEKIYLTARTGFKQSQLNKDERLPADHSDRVPFRSVLPSATFNYRFTPEQSLYINYSTSTDEPSVEQLRNELDYSNPLSLSGGNPNLKQSFSQSFSAGFITGESEHSRFLAINLSASVNHNNIATRRTYFTEPTTLTQFNGYVAPKGSTLSTPVNVNGGGDVGVEVGFSQEIKPLQGSFFTHVSGNFNRMPSYVDDELNYSNSYSPSLGIGFNSIKSLVYQFSVSSNTSYNRTVNSQKANNETLRETVSANFTLNLFDKRFYIGANYNYTLYHNFTYSDGGNQMHVLNARIGYRLFDKRQMDISVQLSDLLNRTASFASRTLADYIAYSWTERAGRYYMFNISYRFNKLGHTKRGGGGNHGPDDFSSGPGQPIF